MVKKINDPNFNGGIYKYRVLNTDAHNWKNTRHKIEKMKFTK
jgi:hypothetical protein